ncbi:MAG: restriction endonuclease [Minisyncoccia bacterium]
MKSPRVTKQDGSRELFQAEKLCGSMQNIGASEHLVNQVCGIVSSSIASDVSTTEIFNATRKYLHQYDPGMAALYALERGLSALGPSGFLFEQYVASLFMEMDYTVTTNVYAQGEGVTHEIDVWAEKGNVVFVVEAKYRNEFKSKTHINQIMYADARLGDIRRQAKKTGDNREFYMWVITNTKFTDNAINYVEFRDIQLMGWNFPKYINLMKIVYEKKMYPVTILPSITKKALNKMADMNIVLVKQLTEFSLDDMKQVFGLSMTLSKKLHAEVLDLMKQKTV